MSDLTPSPDDAVDELLSAFLDGEADERERARVERDPDLQRRLEQLRSVRDLVAAPVPSLDELTARRLRDRAVAAVPSAAAAAGSAQAAPMGAAARARSAWFDPRRLGAVAAVLVLVALALPLARSLGDRDHDDASDQIASNPVEDEAESAEEMADAAAMSEGGGDESAGSADYDDDRTDATGLVTDLGEADTDDELAERVDTAIARSSALEGEDPIVSPTGGRPESDACSPDGSLTLVTAFTGRVDGEDRIVYLLVDEMGAPHLDVVDPTSCEVLLRRP